VRVAAALVALVCCAASLEAQARVSITDRGHGAGGRILEEALARPHRLVEPDTTWFILGRNEQERTTIIVLGRTAAIAGKVDGDVIVVGGDLFVRPGADISGRAIAIGGGAYPSTLAHVGGGSQSFRDNTYDITRTGSTYRLAYRSLAEYPSPPLLFPGVYGLRLPAYDRVNGLSAPFGPALTFAGGRGEVHGLVTYRSDLGKIDPSLRGGLQMTRRLRGMFSAQRGTFTNDSWIWTDAVNSLSVLVYGDDTRNYYRADRAELTLHRLWEGTSFRLEPFIGGLGERAWSVGPAVGELRGPWSVIGRDTLSAWRPNPAIDDGTIASALGGARLEWESGGVKVDARSRAEMSVSAPTSQFLQVSSDLGVGFLTFGEQEYAMDVHWVTTPGPTPPRQRFAYLGGSGTLPFNDMLSMGGGELLLVDQRYSIPLTNVTLGLLGMPTLQFRHRFGSAGADALPSFEQILGVGLMLTIVRAELQLDPRSRRVRFGAGFTFSR
jgi:hypothetical protein